MLHSLRARLVLFVALLTLASCGVSAAAGCTGPNTSPGTQTSGPIVIATDHSTYPANGAIKVTVTNTLKSSIFAADHAVDCTILALQGMNAQTPVAPANFQGGCPIETPTRLIEIKPGQPYSATITGGYLRPGAFVPGTYRLVLAYYASSSFTSQRTVMNSQNFTISTCGVPTPASHSGSPGVSVGTPVQLTPVPASTSTIKP